MQRNSLSSEDATKRIDSQMTAPARALHADVVLSNDHDAEVATMLKAVAALSSPDAQQSASESKDKGADFAQQVLHVNPLCYDMCALHLHCLCYSRCREYMLVCV